MEIKDLIFFNDKDYKPYTAPIGKRYNITFTAAEAAELDAAAQRFNIDPQFLVHEAIKFYLKAAHIEAGHFFDEVKRCQKLQYESLTLEFLDAQRKLEAARKGLDAVQEKLPECFFDKFSEGRYYETNEDQKTNENAD